MLKHTSILLFIAPTFAIAVAACSSSIPQRTTPTASPSPPSAITSSITTRGHGYPYGHTGSRDPFVISERSTDPTYGARTNPIKVGGSGNGSAREQRFLSALRGPNGQEITYERSGACCPFEIPGEDLGGMLDVYVITYSGQATPTTLYVDMYSVAPMLIPVGFTPLY